jgi:hypothetical protein
MESEQGSGDDGVVSYDNVEAIRWSVHGPEGHRTLLSLLVQVHDAQATEPSDLTGGVDRFRP